MKLFIFGFIAGSLLVGLLASHLASDRSEIILTRTVPNNSPPKENCRKSKTTQASRESRSPSAQQKTVEPQPTLKKESPKITLPAPVFHKDLPTSLDTVPPGEVKVQWTAPKRAKRTRVYIYDHNNKLVKTNSTVKEKLFLKNIPYNDPSKPVLRYTIRLSSQDKTGQWGQVSKAKTLWVHKRHFESLRVTNK